MALEVYKYRNGLGRTIKALKKGSVTLGFIGGSISTPSGNRWPEYITAWFMENFPDVRIYEENAAIGATGSDLAVFRAERDLINRNCDLVFIEYAVNDIWESEEKRMRTREGLIRKLLNEEERDIILVYTFMQAMYEDMINGKVPDTIKGFENLGEHYGISSIWMGLYALEEVKKHWMKWEEWLPDGTHTDYRGSYSYAQSVIQLLERELIQRPNTASIPWGKDLPLPLNDRNWENTYLVPFSDVKLKGPWSIKRWPFCPAIDQVLETVSPGARISFKFIGRGLSIGFDFGKTSSEFRYSLDGAEWIDIVRERPDWIKDLGWFRITNIADDLAFGEHTIDIEVTHGNKEGCKGTNFCIAFIGVIK